jgi:hypothetical protein
MRVTEVHFTGTIAGAVLSGFPVAQIPLGPAVVAPEWQTGAAPQPVAYASRVAGAVVTIGARFVRARVGRSVRVRAIGIEPPPGLETWCQKLRRKMKHGLRAIGFSIDETARHVLGSSEEQEVTFRNGLSALTLFTLPQHRLRETGAGQYDVTWQWQYRRWGLWHSAGLSTTTIYVTVDEPKSPWGRTNAPHDRVPWVDALRAACTRAQGARDVVGAVDAIVRAVYGIANVGYHPQTVFGHGHTYNLTGFLAQVNGRNPFVMNCTDSANATATLANLLGCELLVGCFVGIQTRKILPLNTDPMPEANWQPMTWRYHEICWLERMGQNEFVYDACLRVDMDDNYADQVHIPKHPIRMRFGTNGRDDYRHRLVDAGPAALQLQTARRRDVR